MQWYAFQYQATMYWYAWWSYWNTLIAANERADPLPTTYWP